LPEFETSVAIQAIVDNQQSDFVSDAGLHNLRPKGTRARSCQEPGGRQPVLIEQFQQPPGGID
jgi:hypothetical protein